MSEGYTGIIFPPIRSFRRLKMNSILPIFSESSMTLYPDKYDKHERIRRLHHICLSTILSSIFVIIFLVRLIQSHSMLTTTLLTDNMPANQSLVSIKNKAYQLPSYNDCSIRHIYIDIGCFNGETIEHFLHFTSNGSLYDIITFEPDPDNYRACEQRLQSIRNHTNRSVILIPEAVWLRDEAVFFRGERGRESRIDRNNANSLDNLMTVQGLDFSLWLNETVRLQDIVHLKVSTPGLEIDLFEKMLLDDTINLADKLDIEWTDRYNLTLTPRRVYIQLMLDSLGFDTLYFTRLHDVDNVFRANGTYKDVPKHGDWRSITAFDTYAHYVQRPDMNGPFVRKRIS